MKILLNCFVIEALDLQDSNGSHASVKICSSWSFGCHWVANVCTTEMQVTSLVPRPSTPHTRWMGRSVEGLGTRPSTWPTWPRFTAAYATTGFPLLLNMISAILTTHCTNHAVASRLMCNSYRCFDPNAAVFIDGLMTSLLSPTSVHCEDRRTNRTTDPKNTSLASFPVLHHSYCR